MSATLRLARQGAGIELRRGTFEVVVDGAPVGTIEWQGTSEAPVEPGRHVLRVRKGRYSSGDHAFEAKDGEVVTFRCHGAMLWPRFVVSLVKPDLAISVRPEEPPSP